MSKDRLKSFSGSSDSLIDKSKALELLGGDEQMLDQIFDMFVSYVPTQIAEIERAFKDREIEKLDRIAHSLKSNAGTIGCEVLRQAAYDMELSAKRQDIDAFDAHFARFRSILDSVIREIGEMKPL